MTTPSRKPDLDPKLRDKKTRADGVHLEPFSRSVLDVKRYSLGDEDKEQIQRLRAMGILVPEGYAESQAVTGTEGLHIRKEWDDLLPLLSLIASLDAALDDALSAEIALVDQLRAAERNAPIEAQAEMFALPAIEYGVNPDACRSAVEVLDSGVEEDPDSAPILGFAARSAMMILKRALATHDEQEALNAAEEEKPPVPVEVPDAVAAIQVGNLAIAEDGSGIRVNRT